MKAMRIVALGDSLTVGAHSNLDGLSDASESYSTRLETLAQQYSSEHKLDMEVNVINRGISGDLTSGMLDRFESDVIAENADSVIILGGTNDVGWNLDTALIASNLGKMYTTAQENHIKPVACSIPSILGFDELIPPRLQLNRLISTEADRRNIAFVDVFAATADQATNRLAVKYSADGLHLNDQGYERISLQVFDQWLKPLLVTYRQSKPTKT